MRLRFPKRQRLACAAALIGAGIAQLAGQTASPRALLILGGTLIDGSGAPARRNAGILLEGGRIAAVGPDAEKRAPKDAGRLDATGKWILPGLIDAHIHLFQSGGLDARPDIVPAPLPPGRTYNDVVTEIQRHPEPYLRAYLCAGITSVIDMGGPRWEFVLRERADRDPRLPRMAFTGPLLMTGSGGGGGGGRAAGPSPLSLLDEAFWGMPDEATARQQVDRLAGYRPDLVKIVLIARDAADLAAKAKVVRAAVAASHAAGLKVAIHAQTLDTAMASVEAGADILVHSVGDLEVSDEFVKAVVGRGVIVAPTLIVNQMYREVLSGKVTIEPLERRCAPAHSVASFDVLSSLNIHSDRPDRSAIEKKNLKRLAEAGATIYAGSDAGNSRTLHGPSLHRELAQMADAGLPPMTILVAATRTNARIMGREKELGQIAPGMLADVLLLDADPLADIHNTQRIFKVIRGGETYER